MATLFIGEEVHHPNRSEKFKILDGATIGESEMSEMGDEVNGLQL